MVWKVIPKDSAGPGYGLIRAVREGRDKTFGTLTPAGIWEKDFDLKRNTIHDFHHPENVGLGIDKEFFEEATEVHDRSVGLPLRGFLWRVYAEQKGGPKGPRYSLDVPTVKALVAAGVATHYEFGDHGPQWNVPIRLWRRNGRVVDDPHEEIAGRAARSAAAEQERQRRALEVAHGKKAAALELAGQETLF